MAGKPIPKPCFLDDCEPVKAINNVKRWRDANGRLYTWDALHGEIEMFDRRGKHLGVLDPNGEPIKEAVKGRTIDV